MKEYSKIWLSALSLCPTQSEMGMNAFTSDREGNIGVHLYMMSALKGGVMGISGRRREGEERERIAVNKGALAPSQDRGAIRRWPYLHTTFGRLHSHYHSFRVCLLLCSHIRKGLVL